MLDTDTQIPHDIGAERAILGAVMLAPNAYYRLAAQGIEVESFYREPHRLMWDVFASLVRRKVNIDVVTVSGELEDRQRFDELGGYSYIAGLPASCPGIIDAPHYADIVLRKARARSLLLACQEATARLLQGDDPDVVGAEHQAQVIDSAPKPESCSWESATQEQVVNDIRNGGTDSVLESHLPDLNREIGGAIVGEVTVVVAPPRTGKSVLCAQWGEHLAVELGIPGCEFALEMTRKQESTRRLARWASIDYGTLQAAQRRPKDTPTTLSAGEWSDLLKAQDRLSSAPIATDEELLTIEQIWARTKAGVARDGWRWVVIDHFHIVRPTRGIKGENDVRGHIARGLKALAKDCGVAVIVAAHMNRGNAQRSDKRPTLGDVRYGGELEGIAASIIGIYRDELTNPGTEARGIAELNGIKARFGTGGSIKARWEGRFQRFRPLIQEDVWGG